MPRPGPRPYECPRKAWHSDRHHPIRGSLIQEIFRLVHEVHKAETKKNKEWQENLPIVVLKAEEIIYSKANCEAEYVDLSTLGDRVNDAVNTIIRRDDESEDGMFLQPCIEAALQLGCIPRRSTRSQRYSNAGFYLTSPANSHPESLSNKALIPLVPQQSNFVAVDNSPTCLGSHKSVDQQYTCSNSKILCSRKSSLPFCSLQYLPMQPTSTRSSSIYPLHFGDPFRPKSCIVESKTATTPESHFIGNKITRVGQNGTPMSNSHETKCDLSLRLGQLVNPSTSTGAPWSQEMEISGSISSQRRRLISHPKQKTGSDFCFFPGGIDKEQLNSSSLNKSQEISMDVENFVRKRKETTSRSSADAKSDWQLKVPSKNSLVRILDL